ncbi:MAG: hypothetical protein GEV28_30475 [Actinophytocola sp.]|uniref:FeoC-like transcriptional regulator n=1 Tax=Actinophytocola sp. TaxID=1872138 RepID=UPI00132059DB|nr:FeoC-like transcriptional regulator [Actinophytocola sp.]MPZ84484.1 hypothetical protein [Actinophytocola sp.]
MSHLARVLAEIRASTTATGLDELARRLGVSRDDLDALIGYWVHRGELVVDETIGCTAGSCHGCALAAGGCAPRRSGPVLVTIRPARPE